MDLNTETELPDIPEALKREPKAVEKIEDKPIEIEREFVSVEAEGGNEVTEEKE